MPTTIPKRYMVAFASVPNKNVEGESIPIIFIENPPKGSDEEPRVVGYTDAFVRIPKFEKYEFEGNRIAPRKKGYVLNRNDE